MPPRYQAMPSFLTTLSTKLLRRFRTPYTPLLPQSGESSPSSLTPPIPPATAPASAAPRPNQIPYLDGLRGLACLSVYIWHFSWPYQPQLFFAYGLDDDNTSLTQLPFVRLVYAGDAMVRVFFVLSGLVLSVGPLRAAHDGDIDRVAKRVASLGIRRGFRLFIPPIAASIATLVAACVGSLDNLPPSIPPPTSIQEHARVPVRQASVWLQVTDWLWWVVRSLTNPWPPNPDTPKSQYGSQFWTIPHEFRCSMTVFMLLVVLAPVRKGIRIFLVFGMAAYCMLLKREQEELSLFLAGMGLADMEIWRTQGEVSKKHTGSSSTSYWMIQFANIVSWLSLSLGLYLLSWPPNKGYLSPPFRLLGIIDKQHNHWHNVGAVLLLYSVLRVRLAQSILSLRPVLYLGKISYALYCVHYLIVLVAGRRLLVFFWVLTGTESWIREQGGFVLAFGMTTCAVIVASDLFHRTVDVGAIRFARMVEGLVTK